MPRGPKPKPTKLLELRGSWRAKNRKNEPKPKNEKPVCPHWISSGARKVWKDLIPQLTAMGVCHRIESNILVRYCEHFTEWRRCREYLNEHGSRYPVRDKDGNVVDIRVFPEALMERQYSKLLLETEREFGMTPSSRARLGMVNDRKKPTGDDAYFRTG